MIRILDITLKDWLQLLRDRKVFLFLLVMPVALTFLFGFAFGGFSKSSDPRLPVGFLDEDNSPLSRQLQSLLASSQVIRLEFAGFSQADLESLVADEKLAMAILIPRGYGRELKEGKRPRLTLIGDVNSATGRSVESEALACSVRLEGAVRTARVFEQVTSEIPSAAGVVDFNYILDKVLEEWQDPPIRVVETTSSVISDQGDSNAALANTSPGMMLQFAIAGLLTSAQIIVAERKSRCLQRLLTTATARLQILLGHYLAILVMIFLQFLILLAFGQFILHVNYLLNPPAVLLVAFCSALCIAALGLLIGVFAHSEEQAVIFSLVPMFILAGLGGAWVPLEVAGSTFQAFGHLSPVAWALDGFKNVSIRGLGLESNLLPSAALTGYAVLFFVLAVWHFKSAID
jgi:ABC-2 type transport system permease protein